MPAPTAPYTTSVSPNGYDHYVTAPDGKPAGMTLDTSRTNKRDAHGNPRRYVASAPSGLILGYYSTRGDATMRLEEHDRISRTVTASGMAPAEWAACECSAHYRREQGEPDAPHEPGCPGAGYEVSAPILDWWVDGHCISAASEANARAEVLALYGHKAEEARPWNDEVDGDA